MTEACQVGIVLHKFPSILFYAIYLSFLSKVYMSSAVNKEHTTSSTHETSTRLM